MSHLSATLHAPKCHILEHVVEMLQTCSCLEHFLSSVPREEDGNQEFLPARAHVVKFHTPFQPECSQTPALKTRLSWPPSCPHMSFPAPECSSQALVSLSFDIITYLSSPPQPTTTTPHSHPVALFSSLPVWLAGFFTAACFHSAALTKTGEIITAGP